MMTDSAHHSSHSAPVTADGSFVASDRQTTAQDGQLHAVNYSSQKLADADHSPSATVEGAWPQLPLTDTHAEGHDEVRALLQGDRER
jgi:hypothetical protein